MKTSVSTTTISTLLATVFALIAFAGNSVLCRLALGQGAIDPASFTIIRLFSGAVTMAVVILLLKGAGQLNFGEMFSLRHKRSWLAALMLLAYAVFFAYAYVELDTASGALILFAVVQFSMIGVSLYRGYRPQLWEWFGLLISSAGFVLLMLPGATQPSIIGFVLMVLSGLSWAVYTLEGKQGTDPIQNTAENFVRTIPLLLPLIPVLLWQANFTTEGVLLAIASGSITSALGYTIWYVALRQLSITQAAVSQLSVPLIAAVGAVVFVAEPLSSALVVSGSLILGGILLVTLNKQQ